MDKWQGRVSNSVINDLKMRWKGKVIKYLWAEKSETAIAVIKFAICRDISISEDPKPSYLGWDCFLNYIKRTEHRENYKVPFVKFHTVHFPKTM